MKNYYHTLGLSYEAKPELQLINAAYKALVKLYHPDVYEGDRKSLKRKITEINEAYEVLSDYKKKEDYDKELNNYQHKNFSKFSDEDFDDQDLFNEKYVNEDWDIALLVYPELEVKKLLLDKYSQRLGLQFQFYLLETKEFHKLNKITDLFLNAFLEKKFGTSTNIKFLSRLLIENDFKTQAIYLNKLVKVIGSFSEKRILNAFFKENPEIEEKYISKLNYKGLKKTSKNSKIPNFDDLHKPIVLICILILFLFLILTIK